MRRSLSATSSPAWLRNLVATTLVIGVALGIGWRPNASPLEWVGAAGMVALFVFALSWFAAASGPARRQRRGRQLSQHSS